jgi:hypothetical protein
MAQPQMARITCSHCNGWYDSESELRDHMQTAHRRVVSEQNTFPHGGSRFGPPRKHTGAGLPDPAQYPPIRTRCFGCSQPLMVAEISRHILSCDKVSGQDLARFKAALAEFKAKPSHAREVVEEFMNRIRLDRSFDVEDQSL